VKKLVLIILCTLLLTIGCKLYNPVNNGISIEKIREAKDTALQKDSRVHIVWAAGRRKNFESMTNPDMTEVFGFTATAYEPYGPSGGNWELLYEDNEWNTYTIDEPMEIVLAIDLVDVEMDVCDAWNLIIEENYADSFYNWELFQRLHPDIEHPFFAFQVDSGFFIVNTITSEIEFEPY
jgi:hypothetical protein